MTTATYSPEDNKNELLQLAPNGKLTLRVDKWKALKHLVSLTR